MRHHVHEQCHTRAIICTEHIALGCDGGHRLCVNILTRGLVHSIDVRHK